MKRAIILFCAVASGAAAEIVAPGVTVVPGAVNGVIVESQGAALAVYGDPRSRPARVERVLFTHHRRDAAWAGRAQVAGGAAAVVPDSEAPLFSDVRVFWDKFRTGRFDDYSQQSSRILAEPIAVTQRVRGGDHIAWRGLDIEVVASPGYTRGAVSYLFTAGGKRIACTGDLIWGDGRILDIFSLQDAIPETKEDGYHGYAARAADVIRSLRAIAQWKPDVLIPARGPVIRNPQAAIDRLIARLQAVFASHFEIDALRWYRGDDKIRTQAARVLGDKPLEWMPTVQTTTLPNWIRAISNSRLIVSADGPAFLVDCGYRRILDEVKKTGRTVEGIWVTHYHDDHTGTVAEAARELHCPVYASGEMKDILERTERYRMPAQTRNAIPRVETPAESSSRRWHEFTFSHYYFPGQTLYHDALVVKRDGGETILFAGDSFTPTGIDDYCLLNRNFLERDKGYLYCLDLMRRLRMDWIINQHVPPMFRYTSAELDRMTRNLERRTELLRDLFPFDDPNYGTDEQWVRLYPYGNEARSGETVRLQAVVTNHAPVRRDYTITLNLPAGWKGAAGPRVLKVGPHSEGTLEFTLTAPPAPGAAVITGDVAFEKYVLREWMEALVAVN